MLFLLLLRNVVDSDDGIYVHTDWDCVVIVVTCVDVLDVSCVAV